MVFENPGSNVIDVRESLPTPPKQPEKLREPKWPQRLNFEAISKVMENLANQNPESEISGEDYNNVQKLFSKIYDAAKTKFGWSADASDFKKSFDDFLNSKKDDPKFVKFIEFSIQFAQQWNQEKLQKLEDVIITRFEMSAKKDIVLEGVDKWNIEVAQKAKEIFNKNGLQDNFNKMLAERGVDATNDKAVGEFIQKEPNALLRVEGLAQNKAAYQDVLNMIRNMPNFKELPKTKELEVATGKGAVEEAKSSQSFAEFKAANNSMVSIDTSKFDITTQQNLVNEYFRDKPQALTDRIRQWKWMFESAMSQGKEQRYTVNVDPNAPAFNPFDMNVQRELAANKFYSSMFGSLQPVLLKELKGDVFDRSLENYSRGANEYLQTFIGAGTLTDKIAFDKNWDTQFDVTYFKHGMEIKQHFSIKGWQVFIEDPFRKYPDGSYAPQEISIWTMSTYNDYVNKVWNLWFEGLSGAKSMSDLKANVMNQVDDQQRGLNQLKLGQEETMKAYFDPFITKTATLQLYVPKEILDRLEKWEVTQDKDNGQAKLFQYLTLVENSVARVDNKDAFVEDLRNPKFQEFVAMSFDRPDWAKIDTYWILQTLWLTSPWEQGDFIDPAKLHTFVESLNEPVEEMVNWQVSDKLGVDLENSWYRIAYESEKYFLGRK